MPIRALPPEVASQIAAGEVVERPSSVVKELIENALDANASHISVDILEAGRSLIEVSDDGEGIPFEELEMTISRNATSKLSKAEDLFRITTLGFRGEALSSIASVSRLTITSRNHKNETAGRIVVEAGKSNHVESVAAPEGTTVRVEDLFFNVPARLEFMKKDITERRVIRLLVNRYALAYPHVRFHLTQEGKVGLQTSGDGDRRAILAAMYSPEIAAQFIEVNTIYDHMSVMGFSSPTSLTRASRREITFFVNGRWVQDAALSSAVVQAYHSMLMVGRYPLTLLFLQLSPQEVDVNVHPAKSEVRFRHQDKVFSAVQRAIRHALLAHTPVPEINPQIRWTPTSPAFSNAGDLESDWETQEDAESPTSKSMQTNEKSLIGGDIPLLRLVGQIGTAYLVAEGPDGLYLVDQHAAHERVLFERFMSQDQSQIPSQSLLEAVTIELSPDRATLMSDQLEIMTSLGFQIEEFGPNTYKIRAIPSLILGSDPEAAVMVVVEDFEEDETPLEAEKREKIIARVCKRAAVKAGQILSLDEQSALVADLEACKSPRTCPHGRPTMIHLSIDLLERQFGRRGAR